MASALERKATRPRLDSLRSTTSSTAGGFVRPPSPTFSQTTIGSLPPGANAPHLLITRADLRESLGSYEELMSSSKQYRQALLAKSEATARLAAAMEACSRVKGADHSGPGLMSCAGFNHVVSNSEQVLARSFYEDFEIPLLHSLDTYRQEVSDRQANYESTLVAKTKEIRRTESENIRQGKRKGKGRDLSSFRKTLGILQSQVDELDKIKGEYYGEVLDGEDEMWEYLLSKIGMVVKTHVDVYDRLTTKGNDPILEPLLAANPDPFEAYGQADQTEGMFSILPPIGILPPTGSTSNLLSLHSAAIGRTSHPVLTGSNQSSQPLTPKSSRPSTSVAQDSTDEPSAVNLSAEDDDDFLSPRKVESQTDRFGWMMGSKAGSTNGDLLEEEGKILEDRSIQLREQTERQTCPQNLIAL
ncbi:hypothetical protein [Phaffia rhodozyma]|uniref:Uncharacterized protein n=1 Tax=Phaffia rhodozyma TaxID=264483 RepID=A0A0F7SI29_PHARH|nr:hypothetical protein [Phaffia rhodozyma]